MQGEQQALNLKASFAMVTIGSRNCAQFATFRRLDLWDGAVVLPTELRSGSSARSGGVTDAHSYSQIPCRFPLKALGSITN